jgi:hypothetical protein
MKGAADEDRGYGAATTIELLIHRRTDPEVPLTG